MPEGTEPASTGSWSADGRVGSPGAGWRRASRRRRSRWRSATAAADDAGPGSASSNVGDKGLKKGSIGFLDGLAIGLDSTAPAYSLAAVIGSIVVAAGVQAPAVLLVSFIPMFFIAGAFYYMNKVDQDCGTTFSWVTRTLGPYAGWIGGWAISNGGARVARRGA